MASGKVQVFGVRGRYSVYVGGVTVGRFTVKREAEKAARQAAKDRTEALLRVRAGA